MSEPLNPDVYAADVLRGAYRDLMDNHERLCREVERQRAWMERLEADRDTTKDRATSLMETLTKMPPPAPLKTDGTK